MNSLRSKFEGSSGSGGLSVSRRTPSAPSRLRELGTSMALQVQVTGDVQVHDYNRESGAAYRTPVFQLLGFGTFKLAVPSF